MMVWTVKLLISLVEEKKKSRKSPLSPEFRFLLLSSVEVPGMWTGKDSDGQNNVTGHRITCETNLWAHNLVNWGGRNHSKCGSCHLMSWNPQNE